MPVVLDTNVWLDAAKSCDSIKNKYKRLECEIKKQEALEAIEVSKGDCYVPREVRVEIKRNVNPREAARAEMLIAQSGCSPINADEYDVVSFERAAAIRSKRDLKFRERCTSRQDPKRARNDWRIIAKSADLSKKSGEPVILISRDRNMCDEYCIRAYSQLIDEYYEGAEVVFAPTPLAEEVIKDGVYNESHT